MTLPDYVLRVELLDVEPAVWRRLRVPGHLSLADLHVVLQAAMGWEDRHLYRFGVEDRVFGAPSRMDDPPRQLYDASLHGPADFDLRRGDDLLYVYDFGARWKHRIRVEEVDLTGSDDPGTAPAECLAGGGRCPPEDCGGPPGYRELLAALEDPSHPEHAAARRQLGPEFDPLTFSSRGVNAALHALFEPGGRLGAGTGPEPIRAGHAVDPPDLESELEPEAAEALEAIIGLQRERGEPESRITDAVVTVAGELLILHAETDPDALTRARKPATWAAGALHAAYVELRTWSRRSERMTQEELADLFGVSAGSVSRRSRALRETARDVTFLPFTADSRAGRIFTRALERVGDSKQAERLGDLIARLASLDDRDG